MFDGPDVLADKGAPSYVWAAMDLREQSQPTLGNAGDDALVTELRAALAPRIQVLSLLGQGGMAQVFLGRDPLLKRSIAIKILSPQYAGSDVGRARFTREAQAAATMSHPNIAAVYDVGELPSGAPYFLMQFVDGSNLGDAIQHDGMFAEARARRAIGEVASALAAAHARGLVHRDVKPANVIIDNETKRSVVVDFGISAALDRGMFAGEGTLTAVGTYVGTPRYTSPEQAASDKVTGKSDVYSLGVVAFEMLTGRAPFTDTNPMALLAAHIKDAPPPVRSLRPDLDPAFAGLVDRCLAKDPAQRPDASEIASFLVPEPQEAIEWPPPGLELLRGLGARAAAAFTVLGCLAGLFLLTLYSQPSRGTAAWPELERSILWSMLANIGAATTAETTPDTTPMWLLALGLCFLGAAIALVVLAWRTTKLIMALRRGRRQGYPATVLVSVAADNADDTAMLLNRSGRFAMLTPAQQRQVVRARRARIASMPIGFAGAFLLVIAWSLGPTIGDRYSAELLSLRGVAVLLVPVALGLAMWLRFLAVELRLHGRSPWQGQTWTATRPEFVRDWLKRMDVAVPPHRRVADIAFLTPAFDLALAVTLVVALLVVARVTIMSTRLVGALRGEPGRPTMNAIWMTQRSRVDQALQQLARGVKVSSDDSGAARLLALDSYSAVSRRPSGFVSAGEEAELQRAIPAAQRAMRALGADTLSLPPHTDGHNLEFAASRGSLHRWTNAELAADTLTPWLRVWRRFARSSAGSPPFAYPTSELLAAHGNGWLDARGWHSSGFGASIAQFVLRLNAGHLEEARAIARETAQAAQRLLASPGIAEYVYGMHVAKVAAVLAREVAEASRDTLLRRQSTIAAEEIEAMRRGRVEGQGFEQFRAQWAQAGNLGEGSAALRIIGARLLPAHERWAEIEALVDGYCLNSSEILFGISPKRREFLDSALVRAADLPRTREWVDIQRRRMEQLIADPRSMVAREWAGPADGSERRASGFGMGKLSARVAYCERVADRPLQRSR